MNRVIVYLKTERQMLSKTNADYSKGKDLKFSGGKQ